MMRSKYLFSKTLWSALLAITILCPLGVFAQSVDNLEFVTESYPPFNFSDGGKNKGFAVDILLAALKKLGSGKTEKDVQLLPWARGYDMLQNKKNTCLFSTTRTKERENLFKWAGPIIKAPIVLIAKKSKHIKIGSAADLKKYKIGTVMDDVGEQLLLKEGLASGDLQRTGGTDAVTQNIRKLAADRIDLFSYGEIVAKWEMKNLKMNPDDFESVYTLIEGDLSYAFHKDTPDDVVKKLQGAIDSLRADGTMKKIIAEYTSK